MPNTYETFVHIILEQQVSLASARAALEKLRGAVKLITPENIAKLTDAELRNVYFSRQKTSYVRHLTQQIINKKLDLRLLERVPDEEVREILMQLKGVGNWMVGVYLILVLHRIDLFPIGDIAAVTALKKLKKLPKDTSQEAILTIIAAWEPFRMVATIMLWHYYLSNKAKVVSPKI